MSKYKVGDKFIVEVSEVNRNGKLYTLNRDDDVCAIALVGELELDRLPRAEKTYENGLADAWEAAKKISNMNPQACINVFEGNGCLEHVLQNISPQEAIAKIKEWEDSKEIKRGDEVIIDAGLKGIVINVDHDYCQTIWGQGCCGAFAADVLTKTGRNFADKLDALLGEIGVKQ